MKYKFNISLPSNYTKSDITQGIELILEQFVEKSGRFDMKHFAEHVKDIQQSLMNIPNWELAVKEEPIFSDDELSERFLGVLKAANVNPVDLVLLAKEFNYEFTGSVKTFSSVEMNQGIPPLNQELIVFHPGLQCCVQAKCTYADDNDCYFDNLGIGEDFSMATINCKWLPAKRFEDVKTPGVATVDIRN